MQYEEKTDLEFITRLLEEDGVFFFFEHNAGLRGASGAIAGSVGQGARRSGISNRKATRTSRGRTTW